MIFQIIESGQVYLMILLRIGNWEIQKYHFKVNIVYYFTVGTVGTANNCLKFCEFFDIYMTRFERLDTIKLFLK